MNKKLIMSKSITFILVVAFVVLFKLIFGEENSLIGITTITATLMFLGKDLTLSPIRNASRLVLLNLFIGIAATLSASNMWIGICINFITLFIISYILCYNLENPMYFPFTLQYLFLLSCPVSIEQIPKRLLALAFGGIFIIIVQLIVNRNRISKNGSMILVNVCDSLLSRIELLKDNSLKDVEEDGIEANINAFRKMVYDKREVDYYLTEEGRIKLNLSAALENIYTMLSIIKEPSKTSFILKDLESLILETKAILEGNESKKDLYSDMNVFLSECNERNIDDLMTLQILDSTIFLVDTIDELKNLKKENYNLVKQVENIPKDRDDSLFKYMYSDKKSLRFCYSIRIAITITLGAFITDFFKLSEGRWIMFTILSLVNPLYEVSKSKVGYRVIATILGGILVTVLFSIFKDMTSRTIILMLAGYINSYIGQYKYNMILVTVSAIGSAAIVGNVAGLTLSRIFFVVLGALMAIVANKYIFPYKLEDSNQELEKIHTLSVIEMLREIYNVAEGIKKPHSIKNLLIVTSLVEDKLKLNNQILHNSYYEELIKERRFLVTNIYELYIWIIREKVNPEYMKYVLSEINMLISYENEPIENMIKDIKADIKAVNDLKTKITLSSIAIILKELEKISELKKFV